jgi:hypothetical protein
LCYSDTAKVIGCVSRNGKTGKLVVVIALLVVVFWQLQVAPVGEALDLASNYPNICSISGLLFSSCFGYDASAKLKIKVQLSLDGFYADTKGKTVCLAELVSQEDMRQIVAKTPRETDCVYRCSPAKTLMQING